MLSPSNLPRGVNQGVHHRTQTAAQEMHLTQVSPCNGFEGPLRCNHPHVHVGAARYSQADFATCTSMPSFRGVLCSTSGRTEFQSDCDIRQYIPSVGLLANVDPIFRTTAIHCFGSNATWLFQVPYPHSQAPFDQCSLQS